MTARVVVTPEAEEQLRAIDSWWRTNRPMAPNLFVEELSAGFALLEGAPLAGRRYPHPEVHEVRRIMLRATRYHLYFKVHGGNVIVLAVWSAVRGSGPDLKRPGGSPQA